MPDWQELASRSIAFRAMLVLVLVATVGVMGYLARLRDAVEAQHEASHQHREVRQALEAGARDAAVLEQERLALETLEQDMREQRWRLAAGEGMSDLLDQMALSGHALGLLFERLDVMSEQQGAGYRQIPMDVRVMGRYPALRLWLEQWMDQLRLLRVAELGLALVDERPGWVRAQLQVHAYQASDALPTPGILAYEPAREPRRLVAFDPFRSWVGLPILPRLEDIALEQLEMVGTLARAQRFVALLRSAGHVYRVEVGARLGRNDGVVVSVDERRLVVRERLHSAGEWQERTRYLVLGGHAGEEIMDENTGDGAGHAVRHSGGSGN
ncbi:pilus assembly protein PilP [Pantoea sp. Cy-639]|uniref:pilus assembly protein PilP n=1 Tax=Pantoea sp. Cy-639 TaxID=2608360 RepID=UPI0014237B9B|nr:pilus assembly protein PilP [Pantoea sp. Cy-639]NIF17544.1 type 4a pilus biogenesis protein PilO [Pantoea sp. Cy-639]